MSETVGNALVNFLGGYMQGKERKTQREIQEEERNQNRERFRMDQERFKMDKQQFDAEMIRQPFLNSEAEWNANSAKLNAILKDMDVKDQRGAFTAAEKILGPGATPQQLELLNRQLQYEASMRESNARMATEGLQQQNLRTRNSQAQAELEDYMWGRPYKRAEMIRADKAGKQQQTINDENFGRRDFTRRVEDAGAIAKNTGLSMNLETMLGKDSGYSAEDFNQAPVDPAELRMQNDQAAKQFADLTDKFANGDRSRYTVDQMVMVATRLRNTELMLNGVPQSAIAQMPIVTEDQINANPNMTPDQLLKIITANPVNQFNGEVISLVDPAIVDMAQRSLSAKVGAAMSGQPLMSGIDEDGDGVPDDQQAKTGEKPAAGPASLGDTFITDANIKDAGLDEFDTAAYSELKAKYRVLTQENMPELLALGQEKRQAKVAEQEAQIREAEFENLISELKATDADFAVAFEQLHKENPDAPLPVLMDRARVMANSVKAQKGELGTAERAGNELQDGMRQSLGLGGNTSQSPAARWLDSIMGN